MVNAEQVVIDVIANDKALSVLENVRGKLIEISVLSKKVAQDISSAITQNAKVNIPTPNAPKLEEPVIPTNYGRWNLPPIEPKVNVSDKEVNEIPKRIQQKFRTDGTLTPQIPVKLDTSKDNSISKSSSTTSATNSNINGALVPLGQTNPTPIQQGSLVPKPNFDLIKYGYDEAVKSANNFGKQSQDAVKSSYSSFHQLNNMMVVVGGTFNDLGTKIAGIFGVAGLSGMVQKMWQGASQRQQNMLYLMHQKGKEQATIYYNEIMDIVTQLPGDDTFLTNILNMASAMDKSLKLDNLKDAGRAITDYYMSATMKGENSYETQKDLRKYITTGDTRGMRNSVLASELDLLKNRNSVLERTQALEQALKNTGFDGMSGYESASNEFEELKGHFQKAFADLGEIVVSITQPLMQFYNTMDTIFGSRISQGIIIMATLLVGLFTVIGGGLILASSSFRMIETITLAMEGLSFALTLASEQQSIFNTLLVMSIGKEKAKAIATDGNVAAVMRETIANARNIIVNRLGIETLVEEIGLKYALITVIYNGIKAKISETISIAKNILVRGESIILKLWDKEVTISEILVEGINTLAKKSNTVSIIMNNHAKVLGIINTLRVAGAILIATIIEKTNTMSIFANTYAHMDNVAMILVETRATYGLATATAILDILMSPLVLTILALVGAILLVVTAMEKLGEAFGWWKDFGSMFQAIGDGINRIWNAFANSEPVQGIIKYFTDFFSVIQYVWESIEGFFAILFGWGEDNGTFDIVQSIIDIFGKLGEVVKWVWDLLDDWSNSPLGIITWLNPLGILIFHLDEIGSLFEDIGDAINRFLDTDEFQALSDAFSEVWNELQAPFQEIWSLFEEIGQLLLEAFGGDPVGQGTEERINFLVEILKGLATLIRVVVIPAIRGIALAIRIVLTPIRVVLTVIKAIISAVQWASNLLNVFGLAWQVLTTPIRIVYDILNGVGKMINTVSDAIKNSIIGKLLGWDKDDSDETNKEKKVDSSKDKLYDTMKKTVGNSNMDFFTKQSILGELDKQSLNTNNVNNVRNLGKTYNNTNNQRQVVVNQHFSEGSMPIDARNMTKKEAKKMFIGAFGFNRSVGSKGILR